MIRAVTFDFWDTLVFDDSDEPKRAALGLPSKADTRRQLLTAEVQQHHPLLSKAQLGAAFDHANERFRHCWKVEHHTPTVARRLQFAYEHLGLAPTPGFAELVRAVEDMEVEIAPDWVPEMAATLAALAVHYKLGIISDTIHTPGRGLRELLRRAGVLQHFACLIFSDEVGASKPAPQVFTQCAAALGLPLAEIAHVGDRESNDVAGPLALGMRAILFTGAIDRDSAHTAADAVCSEFSQLPAVLRGWQSAP
ncbi:MAG: HAD family hydrolase [Chloroflexi bacterium]|nr:MAG: HAD family hydrolase [Chloroflexota bacterium]